MDVSAVGFGAIRAKGADDLAEVLLEGLTLGINLIDTARAYPGSEETLGKALGEKRSEFIICSRTQARSYDAAEKDLAESMKMLQTDYIDVYQIHQLNAGETDQVIQNDGAARLLEKAKVDGRIKATGISAHHLDEAAKALSTGLFDTLTIPYNLFQREYEPTIARAGELGVGVVAMGPVAGGLLGDGCEALEKELGLDVPMVEAALGFVLANPHVSTACSGMSTVEMGASVEPYSSYTWSMPR